MQRAADIGGPLNMFTRAAYSAAMTSFHRKPGIVPILALAIVLIAAQAIATAHQFGHEKGNTQNTVCAACVAAGQLGSAVVDSGEVFVAQRFFDAPTPSTGKSFTPVPAIVARQRSPPSPL